MLFEIRQDLQVLLIPVVVDGLSYQVRLRFQIMLEPQ